MNAELTVDNEIAEDIMDSRFCEASNELLSRAGRMAEELIREADKIPKSMTSAVFVLSQPAKGDMAGQIQDQEEAIAKVIRDRVLTYRGEQKMEDMISRYVIQFLYKIAMDSGSQKLAEAALCYIDKMMETVPEELAENVGIGIEDMLMKFDLDEMDSLK